MRSQAEDAGMPVTLISILLEMIDAMEQCCRLRQYQQQRKNNGSKQLHSLSANEAAPQNMAQVLLPFSRSPTGTLMIICMSRYTRHNAQAGRGRCATARK